MNRVLSAAAPAIRQVARREINTGAVRKAELKGERVDISHIKKAQKHFQIDDGTPVFLKGGPMDAILYYSTLGLCVIGVGYSGSVIYSLAVPPSS